MGPSDVVLTGFSGGKLSQNEPNPSRSGGWLNCRTGVVALFVFLGFCSGVADLFGMMGEVDVLFLFGELTFSGWVRELTAKWMGGWFGMGLELEMRGLIFGLGLGFEFFLKGMFLIFSLKLKPCWRPSSGVLVESICLIFST